eukprot:scaffold2320_cov168-Ochromonas_danica.AAC.2
MESVASEPSGAEGSGKARLCAKGLEEHSIDLLRVNLVHVSHGIASSSSSTSIGLVAVSAGLVVNFSLGGVRQTGKGRADRLERGLSTGRAILVGVVFERQLLVSSLDLVV